MKKDIDKFEGDVLKAIRARKYLEVPPVIHERGIATIKLRFRIKAIGNGFLQFYYNQDNGKASLALIIKNSRIYGHDYAPYTGWHRHVPPDGEHNHSEEARKPISVDRFMHRVDELVRFSKAQGY
ncbi:hypothetical protein M1N20_02710 [Dehalococcoidia bacterium]|nr:hypothetical protein [Dehalococcoidia bacterium]